MLGDAPEEAETLESLLSTRTLDPSSFSVPIAVVTSDGGPELPSILPRQLLPTPSPSTPRTARTSSLSFSCYRVSRVSSSPTTRTAYNRVQLCNTHPHPHLHLYSLARSLTRSLVFRRPRLSETRSSAMHEHSVGEGPITVPSGTRTPRGTTRREIRITTGRGGAKTERKRKKENKRQLDKERKTGKEKRTR